MILERNDYSDEQKADMICKFMTWNHDRFLSKIKEIGTESGEQHRKIIESFWGRSRR